MSQTPDQDRPSLSAIISATEMNKASGEALALAERGPVGIQKRGRTRYVLLNIDQYDRLNRDRPRRVYSPETTPPDVEAVLMKAIAEVLEE